MSCNICVQRFCTILLFNILGVWIVIEILITCYYGKGRGSDAVSAVHQSQRSGTANQSQHI